MVSSSFYTDAPPSTGEVVAPPAPASFYADPAAAAGSAAQAAQSAASASASAASAAAAVQSAAGTVTPLIDGTAAVGTSPHWAHEDHVHPTDTSRASVAALSAYATTASLSAYALTSSLSSYALTSSLSSYALTSSLSSYAPLLSPVFTGAPSAPTAAIGTNTTQLATTAFVLANAGGGGAPSTPTGRLTLTSLTPVMSSSVAGATRVYFTPYGPPSCPIYNGTAFVQTVFAEVFQDTTDTTKSPSAVVANSNYDLFGWLDGSTFRVTRGPAWTSSSARGTGAGTTDLVWVSGVPLNANAITNGPGSQRGTYLGTIRSNASSTIDYIFGGAASLGLAGVFNVWNCYNRTPVGCRVIDVSATYNYSSATIRQCHGSSSMQVSFVVGLAGDLLNASAQLSLFTTAVAFSFCKIGVQLDVLTSFDSTAICFTGSAVSVYQIATATSLLSPSIGAHVLSMNECSDGTNANSFNQDGTGTHSGLSFSFPM